MIVHPCELRPHGPQELCSFRNLQVHDVLDRLDVSEAMSERADAAGSFGNQYKLLKVAFFHELLQSSVDEADRRKCVNNLLILQNKIQMDRFGKDRVLRPERDNTDFLD